MENKESKDENQIKTPSKVKEIVGIIVKALLGIGVLLILYGLAARKYGW